VSSKFSKLSKVTTQVKYIADGSGTDAEKIKNINELLLSWKDDTAHFNQIQALQRNIIEILKKDLFEETLFDISTVQADKPLLNHLLNQLKSLENEIGQKFVNLC
jgi:hypothetical protein